MNRTDLILAHLGNDMKKRKRQAYGERNGNAKLTEEQVLEIRANKTDTYKVLGQKYGVYDSMISDIKNYNNWKHLA